MATDLTRRNPLAPEAGIDIPKPPGTEIGASSQYQGGIGGWAAFVDEAEFVPQLSFPASIQTYHAMRSDSQIEALHIGTVQPIKEYRWSIDPNKAPEKIVAAAASDLGLPILGHEDDPIERSPGSFDFDAFIADALLAPLYGFMHFEIVGETREGDEWRMLKLAPRHPRLTAEFKIRTTGELEAIRQNVPGAVGPVTAWPEPIPAHKLVPLVWRREAGSHVGRSMLRGVYREWLVKDKTIRIAAINLERAGGVPVIEAAQGATDEQIRDLAQLARQFKVAEGGGGAVPFGSKLNLVGGSVPDAIALLKYCDECMARVWALMLVQLGMTATGNRALGAEFAIYAARAQRAWAKWIKAQVDRFLENYVEWNDPFASYAPLLHFEPSKPDSMSVTDLTALVSNGLITADPELESWLRAEHNLPERPPAPEAPELGELTPEEVALVQNARQPAVLGPDGKPMAPSVTLDSTAQEPTLARGVTANPLGVERVYNGVRASLTLPPRELRRPPSSNEIRAAVDFKGLDAAHASALTKLEQAWLKEVLPHQIEAIGQQVLRGVAPSELAAPVAGGPHLDEHLTSAFHSGHSAAVAEVRAQGRTHPTPVAEQATVDRRIEAQAQRLATLNANAVSLAAQRHAGQLAGSGTPEQVASALEDRLSGMKHVWEREQLRGAVTMAQNQGRIAAFEAAPGADTATYEASEILDDRTCDPCEAIDGHVYDTLEEAEAEYAGGGYVDCEGGPNCRGTLVAIYPEQNTEVNPEDRLSEPDEPYTQPNGDGAATDEVPSDLPEAPSQPFTPNPDYVDAQGLYHVYHGTNAEAVGHIAREGLKTPEQTGPGWKMLTTSREQAARYAEGVGGDSATVLHYAIPAREAPHYLTAPDEHNVYGHVAEAHGLLHLELPSRYLVSKRRPRVIGRLKAMAGKLGRSGKSASDESV